MSVPRVNRQPTYLGSVLMAPSIECGWFDGSWSLTAGWVGTTVATLLADEGSDHCVGGDGFRENQSGEQNCSFFGKKL